jgi:hypothetical protein
MSHNQDIARVDLSVANGGLGSKLGGVANVLACIGACSTGTPGELRQYSSSSALIAARGYGPTVEGASAVIEDASCSILLYPTAVDSTPAMSTLDTGDVTGSSAVTITGTPKDFYRFAFKVVTAWTVGTAGGTFKYSLDGGRVWSPKVAAGTATSYAVPNTGLTIHWGVGDLHVDDEATCWTLTGPGMSSSDFAAAFAAFGANGTKWPALLIAEPLTKAQCDDLATELATYASDAGREVFAFVSTRTPYEPAALVDIGMGAPTVEFVDGGGGNDSIVLGATTGALDNLAWVAKAGAVLATCTKAGGTSYITLGFKAAQWVLVSGSDLNNGLHLIDSVAADVLTFAGDTVVTDADDDGVTTRHNCGSWREMGFRAGMTITVTGSVSNNKDFVALTVSDTAIAVATTTVTAETSINTAVATAGETFADYQSAWRTEFDALEDLRIACGAAAGKCASPIGVARWRFRRSPAIAAATRFMQFGPEESLAKVENGPLPSRWSILDANGNLEEHDSNIASGLASLDGSNGRAITLQQHDDFAGVYICTPSMMHAPGSDFSRVHLRAVMDQACRTSRVALTLLLHSEHELNPGGTLRAPEIEDIENSVNAELRKALRAGKPKCSRAWIELATTDIIATPGTKVGCTVNVTPLGYIEGFDATLKYTIEVTIPES